MTLNPDIVIGSLLAVLIALTSWTLYTVHGLATNAAGREERDKAQDQRIDENRSRIIGVEDRVNGLEVSVGRLRR